VGGGERVAGALEFIPDGRPGVVVAFLDGGGAAGRGAGAETGLATADLAEGEGDGAGVGGRGLVHHEAGLAGAGEGEAGDEREIACDGAGDVGGGVGGTVAALAASAGNEGAAADGGVTRLGCGGRDGGGVGAGDELGLLIKYATDMVPGVPGLSPVSLCVADDSLALHFTRLSPAPVTHVVEASADLVT
jgi:hypothetical protein